MNFTALFHRAFLEPHRAGVLADHLAQRLPRHARVLDVGCGDGRLAFLLTRSRPDLRVTGIEVLVRDRTEVPVIPFDGERIPFRDASFDSVMFVDVLHHVSTPEILLAEAKRVAVHSIVIKDHACDGLLAGPTLRLMDWVGNAHHGVALPYNYWPTRKWLTAFDAHGLAVEQWTKSLHLYPFLADRIFDRSLHFIAVLGLKQHDEPAARRGSGVFPTDDEARASTNLAERDASSSLSLPSTGRHKVGPHFLSKP